MSPKILASLRVAAVCTLAAAAQPARAVGDPPAPASEAEHPAQSSSAETGRGTRRGQRADRSASAAAGEDAGDGLNLEESARQLEAARRRLEEDAREVTALTLSGLPAWVRVRQRSIIGALLDPAGSPEGLTVRSVSPGGPAEQAGLRAGDVVTDINGTSVRGGEAGLSGIRTLGALAPESQVSLQLLRDGRPLKLTVTTRAAPSIPPIPHIPAIPDLPAIPEIPSIPRVPRLPSFAAPGWADLELATLSAQLGHYFGAAKGVLVVRAPADAALGLKDGDVILAIDGREAVSSSQVTRILASYQRGEKLTLRIIRDHQPLTLEVALPARQARSPGDREAL